MRERRLWIALIGLLLIGVVVSRALIVSGDDAPRRPPLPIDEPAGIETVRSLQQTYDRYQRALYDAEVARDPVGLTGVLYNDPVVDLTADDSALVKKYRGEVFAVLNRADAPVGVDRGFLSAEIARYVWRQRGIAVREAVETRAAITGRNPHHEEMPDGLGAFVRAPLTSWGAPSLSLTNVRSDGRHALAEIHGDVITHVFFTNVEGSWYVSDLWTEKRH